MLSTLGAFLVYWVILFVICYVVVEFGQNYLYDETTPNMGLKVTLGSLALAAMLTWTRSSYDTMFTEDIGPTVLQAIVWFAVFTLVLRFHPLHAAAIGITTMALFAGLATLGADNLTRPNAVGTPAPYRGPRKPMRAPASPSMSPRAVAPKDRAQEPKGPAEAKARVD